jgi:photosystem II stability/assembly factor-like uncharacterized protein
MKNVIQILSIIVLFTLSFSTAEAQKKKKDGVVTSIVDSVFGGLEYRNIGPFRGGRSVAVSGVRHQPLTYYMGTTGGGMWKTEDAGNSWNNISDKFFKTGSVGAIGVAESDPNVIYVGMGEHAVRGVMTSHGDGMYKSTDAGATWKHIGLPKSRHISDVIVDPRNADVVYVAVQGEAFGPSIDKGIYKSVDGGTTWKKIHFVNEVAGASGLTMDMNNPRILYAASWDNQRKPWEIRSGGDYSGIYKSADSGETWAKLSEGLPEVMGKIGVTVSRANSRRLYAVIEAEGAKGGVYTSTNGGDKWTQVSGDRENITRAWYYMEIFADPTDEYSVIVCNAAIRKSIDGGKTWKNLRIPHGDTHDLWINPDNGKNYINANDGGGCITYNDAQTWSTQNNQPTAQFYRVNTDNVFPYNLYSGQQDNSSMGVASRTVSQGIKERDWFIAGGNESAYMAFDPNDPQVIYGSNIEGFMQKYNKATQKTKELTPYPELTLGMAPIDMKYRYNWNPPLIASPHDPNTMYFGANVLLKTTDGGNSWSEVSGDLTRDQEDRQGRAGVPFTNEAAGGENYNTIMYIAESKHEQGVIYVGTDDGFVHLTIDGGATWTNITPPEMKEGIVNCIEVSAHDKGTAYFTLMRYKFTDQKPYIYKTSDYGKTWTLINKGLDADVFVRAIREDHKTKGVLYAGTERGIVVSVDDGSNWSSFRLNMPAVPITDLRIQDNDLCVATAGRGFWILDDLGAVQQSRGAFVAEKNMLFQPKQTVLFSGGTDQKIPGRGQNPKNGVIIDYYLADAEPSKKLNMYIHAADGTLIRSYSAKKDSTFKGYKGGPAPSKVLPTKHGVNRIAWDFGMESIPGVDGQFMMGNFAGQTVEPGTYSISLVSEKDSFSTTVSIVQDPRLKNDFSAYAAPSKMLADIDALVTEVHETIRIVREAKAQMTDHNKYLEGHAEFDTLSVLGQSIIDSIDAWEKDLIAPEQRTFQDVINFENKLTAELMFLKGYIQSHEPGVTAGAKTRFADLYAEWIVIKGTVKGIIETDIAGYNAIYETKNVPAVILDY